MYVLFDRNPGTAEELIGIFLVFFILKKKKKKVNLKVVCEHFLSRFFTAKSLELGQFAMLKDPIKS